MNACQLVGRVTKDIEVRYTQSGTAVCSFTLAVNRRKKEDGADFISCTAWSKVAELLGKHVRKGDRIGVTGRIQTGSYERDGRKVYTTDVVVENLYFLGSPRPQETQESGTDDFVPVDGSEESLPWI